MINIQDANSDWNDLVHEIEFDKNSSVLKPEFSEILRKLCEWSQKYDWTLQIFSNFEDGENLNVGSDRALQVRTFIQREKGLVLNNVFISHGSRKVSVGRA